jgi:hypothetical protein
MYYIIKWSPKNECFYNSQENVYDVNIENYKIIYHHKNNKDIGKYINLILDYKNENIFFTKNQNWQINTADTFGFTKIKVKELENKSLEEYYLINKQKLKQYIGHKGYVSQFKEMLYELITIYNRNKSINIILN